MRQVLLFLFVWAFLLMIGAVIERKWKGKQPAPSEKRWILSGVVNFFFAFTICIFAPFEIYLTNTADFSYSLKEIWWVVIGTALGYLVLSVAFSMILKGIGFEYFILGVFSFTFCAYIQVMFLNGAMKSLTGERIIWQNSLVAGNLFLWISGFVLLWGIKVKFPIFFEKMILFLAGSLTLMQLVALTSLLITTDIQTEKSVGYLSKEGMFELSENENVIVFILDTFDGRLMEEILMEEPDFLAPLKGFTYFPNATSTYSRTYPSVPYLLTGEACYLDKPPAVFVNEAYEESAFLPKMLENQIDLGIYTYMDYLGEDMRLGVSNYVSVAPKLNMLQIEKNMLQMALYRDMPYLVKQKLQYDIDSLNNAAVMVPEDSSKEKYQNFNDEWFKQELENGIQVADARDRFRFYHLSSCHTNLSDPIPVGKYSLEIVYDYIAQMQQLGIYKDATIIITADHGFSGGGISLDMPQGTAVPIMLVKPSGADADTEMAVSEAPVSHADLFSTVLKSFGLESAYGRTIFEIGKQEERERTYYYTALYSDDDGEIELREYSVIGDARNSEAYHFTGNKWDVLYSFNHVADKK